MRRLIPLVLVVLSLSGCWGMGPRGGPPPTPYAPSGPVPGGGMSPVPDLGPPQTITPADPSLDGAPLEGPTLQGPTFPEGAARDIGRYHPSPTRPTSARRPRTPNPIPLSGYYELPPAP